MRFFKISESLSADKIARVERDRRAEKEAESEVENVGNMYKEMYMYYIKKVNQPNLFAKRVRGLQAFMH